MEGLHVGMAVVEVGAGISFQVATGPEAGDGISRSLAEGVYPHEYRDLLSLVRAIVPAGGNVLDLGAHVGSFTLGAAASG